MTIRNEAGQALISTALALVALMGFAGLAIDMGVLRHDKRLQQTAADAAAIAGASNLAYPPNSGVTTGAQDAATRNGFTDNGGGQVSNCTGAAVGTICVEVNNPPKTGPHGCSGGTCDPNYVEALVAVVQPTYFMRILSVNSETITARAVAGNLGGGAGYGCLYTLSPPPGINGISGSGTLNASNCGIVDNGDYDGSALTVSANNIAVSGSSEGGSATCTTPAPCPTSGAPEASDPLINLQGPGVQSPSSPILTTAGMQTLLPGTYPCIIIGSGSTVTLKPGIYYINGCRVPPFPFSGVSFMGKATVQGTGVMFYFTNGASIDADGGGQVSNIQLSAPTSGPYAGILMFQDPNDFSSPTLGGDDNSFFDGVLYFPEGNLTFFGNTTGAGFRVGIVDADALIFSGSPVVNLQGSAGLPPGVTNPITSATLVE